jgi:hypothetical protein
MTALAFRALAFAERYRVVIAVVGGDRLSWQSQGPTPGRALEALKAAKGELIDLLVRYRLDSAGGLAGDDLLAALQVASFAVRRYGLNAALDDALGGALHRPRGLSSLRLRRQTSRIQPRAPGAPGARLLQRRSRVPRDESVAIGTRTEEPNGNHSAAPRARELLVQLRALGFRAKLDRGALYLADTSGWQRDLSRFISPALVFEVLNAGLDDDPALLAPTEGSLRRATTEESCQLTGRIDAEVAARTTAMGIATIDADTRRVPARIVLGAAAQGWTRTGISPVLPRPSAGPMLADVARAGISRQQSQSIPSGISRQPK